MISISALPNLVPAERSPSGSLLAPTPSMNQAHLVAQIDQVELSPSDLPLGSLYICQEKLVFFVAESTRGYEFYYPNIGLHAIERESNSLYCHIDPQSARLEEEEEILELRFKPKEQDQRTLFTSPSPSSNQRHD